MKKRARHAERGQTMILVAICVVLFIAFTALVVDVGYLEFKQRTQQTAADAAAIAGAWYVMQNGTDPAAAARAGSSKDGFTHDGSNVNVQVYWPPQDGPHAGNKNAVEVTVQANHRPFFAGIFGTQSSPVTTRAVAEIENNPTGPCIWAMDKDITINNGTVTAPCGMMAARNVHDNGASLTVPSIGAGGSVSYYPPGTIVSGNIPPFNDPCSTIPGCAAMTAAYPFGSAPAPAPVYSTCATAAPASGTISPGCYAANVGDGTYDLLPGLYVFQGNVGKNGVVLTCSTCVSGQTGVTLIIGGSINFNGVTSNLVAPPAWQGAGPAPIGASGVPGVLIYQTTTSTSPENFSAQQLLGMIYAPGAHINLNAGSVMYVSYIVAADIVANKAVVTVPGPGGNLAQLPVLVE